MNDPYKVLGISPDATDEQVKAAYREMARKYHPDNYTDNPLSDLAQEKMQEINEAYDTIVRSRKQGGSRSSGGSGRYSDIRRLITEGRVEDAETLLNGTPAAARDAEWHFLKGSVLYKKGWLEDAYSHFTTACRMDPTNAEYRAAYDQMSRTRQTGTYTTGHPHSGASGCSGCDVCGSLLCADFCCECMGGDLIRCC